MPTLVLDESQTAQIHMPCWIGVARARGGCLHLVVGGEDRDGWPASEDEVKEQVARLQAKLDRERRKRDTDAAG